MMYHYTYLIENKINSKKYIGVRSCHDDPNTDFYWSSSITLKNEITRVGRNVGTRWFTNGLCAKRFVPGAEPPGFIIGKKY
jgi:hypothetical protein